MIHGIGIDVVDIKRFQESVDRTPTLLTRLFTETEYLLPGFFLVLSEVRQMRYRGFPLRG